MDISNNIDYTADGWFCPAYNKEISKFVCAETEAVLSRQLKPDTVPEVREIENIEEARKLCSQCPYSE